MGLKRIFSKSSVITDSKSVMSSDSESIPSSYTPNKEISKGTNKRTNQVKRTPPKTHVSAAAYLSLKG